MKPLNQHYLASLVDLLNAGRFADAEASARALIKDYPQHFILHHLLGIAQDGQNKPEAAISSYHSALKLNANMPEIHFNLGIAYARTGKLQEAIECYRNTIKRQPKFFEAYTNLGSLLQTQGLLEEAVVLYRQALHIEEDARGHFNLGTALRDQGKLDEALQHFERAIALSPNDANTHNYRGEVLRDQGKMEVAIEAYLASLKLDPAHAGANYNMGEFLYLAQRFDEAVTYFERSQLDDWQERSLCCLYKAEQFERFKTTLDAICQSGVKHNAPLLATLAAHYALNFGVDNPYQFCPDTFHYVYQRNLAELAPGSPLLKALLHDIDTAIIAERKQAMLHTGKQSAGSLFKRPEASFRQLAELVKQEFVRYRNHYQHSCCELIRSFPKSLEFTSSWYIKMKRGGYLAPHIHEIGWISGAVYLSIPNARQHADEGAFEYGFHGDNYPQRHQNFPTGLARLRVGDIVLFPSSLFHRTIPFSADEERICIAFDLKPDRAIFRHSPY